MTESNGDTTAVYEKKFAGFISVCEKANPSENDVLIIDNPKALGDDYDEIVESLNRLDDAVGTSEHCERVAICFSQRRSTTIAADNVPDTL